MIREGVHNIPGEAALVLVETTGADEPVGKVAARVGVAVTLVAAVTAAVVVEIAIDPVEIDIPVGLTEDEDTTAVDDVDTPAVVELETGDGGNTYPTAPTRTRARVNE